MRHFVIGWGLVLMVSGCPGTTSPSVPKPAIEKAADTKIPDAGLDGGENVSK